MEFLLEANLPDWKASQLDALDQGLKQVIQFYYSKSCPCQFPRFRQFVAIDMFDFSGTFYCYESDRLVMYSLFGGFEGGFDIAQMKEVGDKQFLIPCKTCESIFIAESEEYGHAFNRRVLKLKEKEGVDIGREAEDKLPVFIGLLGYKVPELGILEERGLEEVLAYLLELA